MSYTTTRFHTGRNQYRGFEIPPKIKAEWYRASSVVHGLSVGQAWCRGIDADLVAMGIPLWNEEVDDDF